LVIDIDHFKTINDKYGHPTGDRVLNTIASELNGALSDSHIIGRLGGEEFAIFVSGESRLQTFQLADTLRRKVEMLSIQDGEDEVSVTISIGMTFSNSVEDSWHSLFNTADTELYNAKARGRNQISPRFQVVA
jgi:diguanylate cyclase (GGDEF)-like protein